MHRIFLYKIKIFFVNKIIKNKYKKMMNIYILIYHSFLSFKKFNDIVYKFKIKIITIQFINPTSKKYFNIKINANVFYYVL